MDKSTKVRSTLNIQDNAPDNEHIASDSQMDQTTKYRPKTALTTGNGLPKNICNYYHILQENKVNEKTLNYVLQLRNYNESGLLGLEIKPEHIPNFYYTDMNKHNKKYGKNKAEYSNEGNSRPILHNLHHLIRNRTGEAANASQFAHETSMRNNNINKNTKWHSVPNTAKARPLTGFSAPMNKACEMTLKTNEQFRIKKFEAVYKNINTNELLGKGTKLGRVFVPSKTEYGEFLGEHLNSHYDNVHINKNMNDFRHLLTNNNSGKFQSGLRGDYTSFRPPSSIVKKIEKKSSIIDKKNTLAKI